MQIQFIVVSQCIILALGVAALWSISMGVILEKLLRFVRPTIQWAFIESLQFILISTLIINQLRMQKVDSVATGVIVFINLLFLYFPNPRMAHTRDVLHGRMIAYPIGLGFYLISNIFSFDYRNAITNWINQFVFFLLTIPVISTILTVVAILIMLCFGFGGLSIVLGLVGAKIRRGQI